MDIEPTENYKQVVEAIKTRVRQAQFAALKAVNTELIQLYWDIGRIIVEKQQQLSWGKSVVEQIAKDLRIEFEGVSGFSARNLWYMRTFYETYHDNPKLQPVVAEIGWSHNLIILDKCKDDLEREFYLQMCRTHGWSKYTLTDKIRDKTYERWLLNQTSFENTIPEERRANAVLAVKDDYNFDFIGVEDDPSEQEFEARLIKNITALLSEMGGYFTFAGRQFRLVVNEKEFFIDLLFYHRQLKCLVAVELKTREFEPAHAGTMQFYLSALDAQARVEGENPSIGIIICREKNRTIVEYTLKDVTRPIGVASYNQYSKLEELPARIAKYLPSPTEIEKRLSDLIEE